MEQYKLTQSLVVPTNQNTVPKNGLKVSFVAGVLDGEDYTISRLNSLWALFGLAAREAEALLASIEYEQCGITILIAKQQEKFVVFVTNRGDGEVELVGTYPEESGGLFPVIDPRWDIVYFLPVASLLDFAELVSVVNTAINNRAIGEVTRCPQMGDEVMSIYKKLQDDGLIE